MNLKAPASTATILMATTASPLVQTSRFQKPSSFFTPLAAHQKPKTHFFHIHPKPEPNSASLKPFSSGMSSSASISIGQSEVVLEPEISHEKFDWFSQWYPIAPVCDLDKGVPHGKRVMGVDVVVWWDRNENAWKVFDDRCPHRLAPLSEGRIDQWGRLQCVYHGWCFSGSGDCKFIPQAPPDGPPVYTFKKACVAPYPCTEQHGIVWFWPNSDPHYKDILSHKQPPYIPELDDPSYTKTMGTRDISYGYEILIENLMDPAHVPYAHYGLMPVRSDKNRPKADREGGKPMQMSIQTLDIDGFTGKAELGHAKFIPPCVFYVLPGSTLEQGNGSVSSAKSKKDSPSPKPGPQRRALLIFICIPVSPGKSRLIWAFPRNFALWMDQIVPRWIFHIGQNLILDSDLYLLHVEERKIAEIGSPNWQEACFVPTKSDALVVGFRKWLKKYSGGQLDWGTKFDGLLPQTPPREQLLDRYWSHVVNCTSCSAAYKGLNVLVVVLQVVSVGLLGIVAATQQAAITAAARITLSSVAVICFAASRWLSHYVYKNFHFHDYNHGFV